VEAFLIMLSYNT